MLTALTLSHGKLQKEGSKRETTNFFLPPFFTFLFPETLFLLLLSPATIWREIERGEKERERRREYTDHRIFSKERKRFSFLSSALSLSLS